MTTDEERTGAPSAIRLVLADDESVSLQALRDFLGEAGYVIVGVASDGYSALEQIIKHQPDVAILDLRMPGLNGIEVATELRNRAIQIPAIILSAYDDAHLQMAAERVDVATYLVKGCSAQAIFRAIGEAAGRSTK